jgi:tetratricopeptide (TPR) repeat protein
LVGGYKEIAELLISKGADVNVKNNDGFTPLILALSNGFKELSELLIAKGAEVNVKDNNSRSPLTYSLVGGYKEIAELLISKGADISVKDKNGDTPLSLASANGFKELIELFIAKGVDVNIKNKDGNTALTIACKKGYNEITELLIKNGAIEYDLILKPVFQWFKNEFSGDDDMQVQMVKKENQSAISWFNAQNFPSIPTDKSVAAEYCFKMANMAQESGIYKEAWGGFHQALHRYLTLKNEKMTGLTCFNLGKLYGSQQNWKMAQVMFLQSAYLSENIGEENGCAWSLYYLGDVCERLGEKYSCKLYWQKAYTIFQKVSPDDAEKVKKNLSDLK